MSEIMVEAEARTEMGKSACRRLRREGRIPAILYGSKKEPMPVAVDPQRLEQLLRGERGMNTLFHLRLSGKDLRRMVMIKEYQSNPIDDRIIHADFIRVDEDKRLQLRVPVRLEGVAEGVKNEGGVLDFVHREVQIECLPQDIPEALTGDVSALSIGQTLTVADLEIPEGVESLDPVEMVLVTIAAPRKIEEVAEVAEEVAEEAAAEAAEGEEGAAPAEQKEKKDKPEE